MFKKLTELETGSEATIRSFENEGLSIKLMEMGCIPGEKITIVNIAPLKDPISISVSGYILSLRLDEADCIVVEEIK